MAEKDEKKGRSFTLRLPDELHEALTNEAIADGRSVASAARVAIEQWINRQRGKRKSDKT